MLPGNHPDPELSEAKRRLSSIGKELQAVLNFRQFPIASPSKGVQRLQFAANETAILDANSFNSEQNMTTGVQVPSQTDYTTIWAQATASNIEKAVGIVSVVSENDVMDQQRAKAPPHSQVEDDMIEECQRLKMVNEALMAKMATFEMLLECGELRYEEGVRHTADPRSYIHAPIVTRELAQLEAARQVRELEWARWVKSARMMQGRLTAALRTCANVSRRAMQAMQEVCPQDKDAELRCREVQATLVELQLEMHAAHEKASMELVGTLHSDLEAALQLEPDEASFSMEVREEAQGALKTAQERWEIEREAWVKQNEELHALLTGREEEMNVMRAQIKVVQANGVL